MSYLKNDINVHKTAEAHEPLTFFLVPKSIWRYSLLEFCAGFQLSVLTAAGKRLLLSCLIINYTTYKKHFATSLSFGSGRC